MLLFYVLVFWLPGMWDLISPTRDQTHTPCTGTRLPGKSPVTQCVLSWNLSTGYYLFIISSFFFFFEDKLGNSREITHIFVFQSVFLRLKPSSVF